MPINILSTVATSVMTLVDEIILDADAESVTFSNLDLATDNCYILKATYQTLNNCANVSLIANANTTVTNYYHVEEVLDGVGASSTVYSENNNILNSIDESLIDVYCEASFMLDVSTRMRGFSNVTYLNTDGTSQNMNIGSFLYNVAENVTSIKIEGDATTGSGMSFKQGSKFQLFRVRAI